MDNVGPRIRFRHGLALLDETEDAPDWMVRDVPGAKLGIVIGEMMDAVEAVARPS